GRSRSTPSTGANGCWAYGSACRSGHGPLPDRLSGELVHAPRLKPLRRLDVLIQPEQIGRIVLFLEQGESIVVRAIRGLDAILLVLRHEVYVDRSCRKRRRRLG